MSVLVVQHLVTLHQATKIMKPFTKGRHAKQGYFFELQDLGAPMRQALKLPGLKPYGIQGSLVANRHPWFDEPAYLLRVHRDVPAR